MFVQTVKTVTDQAFLGLNQASEALVEGSCNSHLVHDTADRNCMRFQWPSAPKALLEQD